MFSPAPYGRAAISFKGGRFPPEPVLTDPSPTPPPAPPEGGGVSSPAGTQVLSRELSAFLVEFSIALHKNQMYPPGHPHLNTALIGFNERIHALLASRPSISIGVARKQLVIEGVATDPDNPLLRELALKLHRHQLGAVKFMPEVQDFEVAEFLALLVQDPYLATEPLGRPADGNLRKWENIWLFPLAYDQLELIEGSEEDGPAGPADRGRGGQLWVGLASAALASDTEGLHPAPAAADPSEVAKAIDEHQGEKTYDQVIVGYMLQIADELKANPNPEGSVLNRRVSRLVSSLRPETLKRLLEMGGDTHQRSKFVLDATQGMAIDAVMELVKAAADAGSQNMSTSLVRLLNKLAVHAEAGDAVETRAGANRELREHVRKLVTGWDLDDPNPNAYTDILEQMSRDRPERATRGGDHEAEPERLIQMAVEVDALGETVINAVDRLVKERRMGLALDILEKPPRRNETSLTLLDYLVTPDRLRALLADETEIDFDLVDRVARRLGAAAAEPLLDAYAAAEQRNVRRKLHDRVTTIGAGIGPQVVARLTGTPWYVQRNMLTLLASMPAWPAGFDPTGWTRHEDARVRREAYRLLFRVDDRRATALMEAVADDDEGIERMALAAATEGCPPALGTTLERIATDPARSDEVRALALRALATLRRPESLPILLQAAATKGGFLRRARLQPKGPEMLAALSGLMQYWADDEDAATVLALAAASEDGQVRNAVRRKGGKR